MNCAPITVRSDVVDWPATARFSPPAPHSVKPFCATVVASNRANGVRELPDARSMSKR